MRAEEICLSEAPVLHTFIDVGAFKTVEQDVALTDPHPRRPPHVEGHAVVALSHEVCRLDCLKTVSTAAGTDVAVAGNYVEGPYSLVVHVGRLEGSVAGVCQGNRNIFSYICVRVNLALWSFRQEIAAGS